MPNTREKLMRLLCAANSKATEAEAFEDATYAQQLGIQADHLIANGVTIPVRCKDCRHRHETVSGLKICSYHITMDAKDGNFCSCGERRTDV